MSLSELDNFNLYGKNDFVKVFKNLNKYKSNLLNF